MATTLSELLFGLAAVTIVVAQVLILRSTRRGMRRGSPGAGSVREWAYAVVPAVALVLVLAWTWRTMHEGTIRFDATVPPAGPGS